MMTKQPHFALKQSKANKLFWNASVLTNLEEASVPSMTSPSWHCFWVQKKIEHAKDAKDGFFPLQGNTLTG